MTLSCQPFEPLCSLVFKIQSTKPQGVYANIRTTSLVRAGKKSDFQNVDWEQLDMYSRFGGVVQKDTLLDRIETAIEKEAEHKMKKDSQREENKAITTLTARIPDGMFFVCYPYYESVLDNKKYTRLLCSCYLFQAWNL